MKRFILLALSILGFVACNNKDLDDVNKIHSGEVETSYIAINLNAVDNSTRADGGVYQEGLAAERKVNSAYFFFFDSEGAAFPVNATSAPVTGPGTSSDVNWISASLTDAGKEMNNVSDIKNAVLLLSTYKGQYPAQIVAVLNWAPAPNTAYSLEALSIATKVKNDDGTFVMSNAVYAASGNVVVGAPITSGDIFKDETNAKANPITIYVERIAAKVTVTSKNVADNRFKVNKTISLGGSNKDVYVEVKGWSLHNDFDQSYLLKSINPSWDNLGFTWNDEAWHRCYWANSLEFSNIGENAFPTTLELKMGNNADVLDGTYVDNTYTYIGENTNYVLGNSANCTKVILKAELQEKDGENFKPLALTRWHATYYAGEEDLRTAVASTIQYQYFWLESTDKYVKIAPEDLQLVKDNNMVKFQLSSTAEGKNWYLKSEGGYTSKTKAEINTLLASIDKAVYYESGSTLYSIDIAHLGNGTVDSPKLGDYGIVRNHIYNVVINSFGGFGSPVYVPGSNLEYPDDPTVDGEYVSAEVRVLSWRLVSNEVDIQPQPTPGV